MDFHHANTTEDIEGKEDEGREDHDASIMSAAGDLGANAGRRQRKKWAPAPIVTPRGGKEGDPRTASVNVIEAWKTPTQLTDFQ